MPISSELAARERALHVIDRVLTHQQPLDEALAADARWAELADQDRRFAYAIVMATLRHMGQIDACLAALMHQPLKEKERFTRGILRQALAELLWLNVPSYAAVHSAVELTKNYARHHSGFVNALLQRWVREMSDMAKPDPLACLPAWLADSWRRAYGESVATAIAEALQSQPPLDITVKSKAGSWAETLGGKKLSEATIRLDEHDAVEQLAGYAEGEWWVQDIAATLPVKLLGEVSGRLVLDVCAAPGGKTMQLAAAGARVTAIDRSKVRMQRLTANLQRTRLEAQCVVADVMRWKPAELYDAILLDAPCSATGTVRRHPDILWLRQPSDIAEMATIQAAMLRRVAGWLKPGGTLVYCVCSLQPEEGDTLVEKMLPYLPLARAPIAAQDGVDPSWVTAAGDLRTLPHLGPQQGGMDGFYAARLVRPAN